MIFLLRRSKSVTTKNIERNILKLPALKRLHLIESLIESLDTPDPAIERAWAVESDRRLAAYKKGLLKGIPLENIKKRFMK